MPPRSSNVFCKKILQYVVKNDILVKVSEVTSYDFKFRDTLSFYNILVVSNL